MTSTAHSRRSAQVSADRSARSPRHRRGMLAVMMAAAFLSLFNETILSVGNTAVMKEWSLSYDAVQWTMTAFLVAMSISVPLAAFVIHRRSTRTVLLVALGFICVGLALDLWSPRFGILVAGRIIEGFGAGFIPSLLFSAALLLTSRKRQGVVTAICGVVIGLGPTLAPLYSGVLLNAGAAWRRLFIVPLVFSLALIIVSVIYVDDVSQHFGSIPDHLSIFESIVAFPSLIAGIDFLASARFVWGWILLIIGLIATGFWAQRQYVLSHRLARVVKHRAKARGAGQSRHGVRATVADRPVANQDAAGQPAPLVNLYAMRSPAISSAMTVILLIQIANTCLVSVYPMAMQPGFALSSVQTSLMMMVPLLVSQLCAPFAGVLFDHFDAAWTVLGGIGLMMVGLIFFGLARMPDIGGLWLTALGASCVFIGIAFVTPSIEARIFSLSKLAVIPDMVTGEQTVMQIGGAMGTTLTMAIFQGALAHWGSHPGPVAYVRSFGELAWILLAVYALCFAVAIIAVRSRR